MIKPDTLQGRWFHQLITELSKRRVRYEELDRYYTGEAFVPVHADKAVRHAYQRLMSFARTNFAELIVEAVRERMQPLGFRTGASEDDLGDSEAWRIWQANALDADAALVHRTSLALGDGYVIVGGVDTTIGAPLITPEDPREVIAVHDPRYRRRTIAALKVFTDQFENIDRAYLYLPGVVLRAERTSRDGLSIDDAGSWEWVGEPETLPESIVPVVRFPNRPGLGARTSGEFETHLGLLNRIMYTVLSRLEIATLQAFRQRAVKGVPAKDETGVDIDYDDIFAADPGALWVMPATAEIWESQQVDLGPLRSAVRDDVQDLAAVTRTPLFYLTPEANNGSAEGASLAREGLVFKTADRLVQAGEAWEQVMALAFAFAGDTTRARRADMGIIWASPERFSLAESYDAAAKAIAAGVPWRTVMTDVLQFSPQKVARMEAERAADAFLTASLTDGS